MQQSYAIETRNLNYHFGSLAAVAACNLRVPKGCICGFLGPNGAGKTTTIRLLLGLLHPSSGAVLIDGHPIANASQNLSNRVGALIETPSLYPNLTGRENLEVLRRLLDLAPATIAEALNFVRLTPHSDRLVRTYSLGMRQRLGLALAFLGYPGLVILDEPANGLDPAGVQELRDVLRNLVKQHGATVFLSSHLLAEVEQTADYVAIMNRGRLLFQGSLEEFQAQRGRSVLLRIDRPEEAASVLRLNGWHVKTRPDGALSLAIAQVSDMAAVNALLWKNNLVVYHLAQEQESLEALFLSVTGGSKDHV